MQQRVHPHAEFPYLIQKKLELAVPSQAGLSVEQRNSAMALILRDTYFGQTILTLTTGVFLVGFALKFGASNLIIGLLASIPALAQLLQLPGIYLVEKFQSRREITFFATLISRLFLLPIILVPFVPQKSMALTILVGSYICHAAIGAIGACAWNSWLKDVVPSHALGSFFGKKMALASLITIVLTFLGGFLLDAWSHAYPGMQVFGYSILFSIALVVGLCGLPFLRRIAEPSLNTQPDGVAKESLLQKLIEPFQNKNFRRLIVFLGAWNFAINLAAPFFAVYMLTLLGFSMSKVTLLTIICQIANLSYLNIWGKLADRFSNKAVLTICAPLFLFCILAWTFATMPYKHAFTTPLIVVLHVLLGIATAGVTLANSNIAMKLAPEGKATTYLATNSIVANLAAGIAPMLGGVFADFFARQQLSLVLHWQAPGNWLNVTTLDFTAWDFFFGLAFLLGLLALSRLKAVREGKRVKERVILQESMVELWRSTAQVSTLIGNLGWLLMGSGTFLQNTARLSGQTVLRMVGVNAAPEDMRIDESAHAESVVELEPALAIRPIFAANPDGGF